MNVIIRNLLFLIKNCFVIYRALKHTKLSKIHFFKFISWHHGYCYFTGFTKNNNKVFIKIDTFFLLLKNEYISYEILKDKNVNLIKVYDFYELDKVQIIIFDFFESSNLNEKHLISNPEHIINEINNTINILSQNNISHRDIKLDNFLFKDNKIFIIDFSFAINIKDKKENLLLELKRSKKNIKTLKNLGINIKNDAFIIWNDYYSMKIILIKIQEKYKLNNLIINKSIILFDSLMLNNNYYYRL